MLGFDVAGDNQPLARMRYAAWRALGYSFAWVEYLRDGRPVPGADAHRLALISEDYQTAGYVNLAHGAAAAQMGMFLARCPAGELPDLLDVEELSLTSADIRAATDTHDASGRRLVLYTSKATWERIIPSAAERAYFKRYPLVAASYLYDTPAGQPVPMDAASVARRSGAVYAPLIPDPWGPGDVFSHQHSGQGSLPGYGGFLDLHVAGPAFGAAPQAPLAPAEQAALAGIADGVQRAAASLRTLVS